jgi:tetratricopeptide (TPR) repeat protein
MEEFDRSFNLEFFENLLVNGKGEKAIKLLYDSVYGNIEDVKRILAYFSFLYLEKKEVKKALPLLKELNSIDPENNFAIFNLGLTYFYLQNYIESMKVLQKITVTASNYFKVQTYILLDALYADMMEIALKIIDEGKFEATPDEIFLIGSKLIEKKEYKSGIELFIKSIEKYGELDIFLFGMGLCLIGLNEFKKAISYFEKIKEKGESFPYVYIALGISYFYLGEIDNAKTYFLNSLDKNLYPDEAYYYLGLIYRVLGELDVAIENIRKAGEFNPKNIAIWKDLAEMYYEKGDLVQAKINYKKCFYLSNDLNFAFKVGLISMIEKDFSEAKKFFETCLSFSNCPDDIKMECLNQLALVSFSEKNYQQALLYGKELVELGFKSEQLFLIISGSLSSLGLLDEAEAILQDATILYPQSYDLLYSLAVVKSNLFKYDEADSIFERILKSHRRPEWLFARALTKMKLKEKEFSFRLFSEYQSYYENHPEVLYKLALFYIELGHKEEALKNFKKIVSIEPENKKAKNYIKLLEEEKLKN